MKRIKIGNALACEFIAPGATGKPTLANVFSGDILVQEMPARISLAFYIEILPDQDIPKVILLQLMLGKKTLAIAEAEIELEPGKMGVIALPAAQVTIQEDTKLKVIATGEGFARTVIIEKAITKGEIPAHFAAMRSG